MSRQYEKAWSQPSWLSHPWNITHRPALYTIAMFQIQYKIPCLILVWCAVTLGSKLVLWHCCWLSHSDVKCPQHYSLKFSDHWSLQYYCKGKSTYGNGGSQPPPVSPLYCTTRWTPQGRGPQLNTRNSGRTSTTTRMCSPHLLYPGPHWERLCGCHLPKAFVNSTGAAMDPCGEKIKDAAAWCD